MAGDFATASDVADRWRPLTPAEENIASTLIADASSMVRARWSDVDTRIASGSLSGSEVLRVVASMVKRAMLNRDSEGVEQRTEATGPFSYSNKYSNPNGNLYFSAEDVRVFEPEGYSVRALVGWLA